VGKVVLGLSRAGSGAERDVEWLVLEELVAHVGVGAIAVGESVDGCVTQVGCASVAGWGSDRVVNITVRTSDGDLVRCAPLTVVDSVRRGDWTSPEDTLDVDCAGWVWAVSLVWVDRWVALKVDVERLATLNGVALGTAGLNIVRWKSSVAHVAISVVRGAQIGKGVGVASRGDGVLGSRVVGLVGSKGVNSVWLSWSKSSSWLRLTSRASLDSTLSDDGGGRNSSSRDGSCDGSRGSTRIEGYGSFLSLNANYWNSDSRHGGDSLEEIPVQVLSDRLSGSDGCESGGDNGGAHLEVVVGSGGGGKS